MGFPGGCGCCSPEWGRNLAEMCGLVACWVGWVLTEDLSGTKTGAAGPTGRSEKKEHSVEMLGQSSRCFTKRAWQTQRKGFF